MNTLVDWLGKADDIQILYDAGIAKNSLLLAANDGVTTNLPAIIYPFPDNIREVEVVFWEESVPKADRLDYTTAVACGAISGLIDIFYVGEFSLENAKDWGSEQTNKFVKKVAQMNGYKGDDLQKAIEHLEKTFPLAADEKTPDFGGGLQHHLRDFSHHFSLGGLMCSLFTQFTGKVIGTDTSGMILIVPVSKTTLIGRNFEEKSLFGTVNWFFHMVSDMAGSNSTPGKGTGIPGPVVSLIKELSTIPCFRDKKINEVEFHTWVSKLFNGTLLAKRDENGKILEPEKFDPRMEIGILHEVGKQFVPVIINECLVRGLYFLRRIYNAVKETEILSITDLKKIDASELLPFNNRVIKRMITVASGVFTAVDVVDAAVRAAIKNGGFGPGFIVDFVLRVNVVGVGRFIIACKADAAFISEDIQEAREKRNKSAREYEKQIADLKCLTLNYEQMRVLYSLEYLILKDDINITKKLEDKAVKAAWKQRWQKNLLESLPIVNARPGDFFLQESEIRKYMESRQETPWQYLLAMEAALFKPYTPIFGNDEDKKLKKLKLQSEYLTERYPDIQSVVSKEDITELKKAHKRAGAVITGSTKNMVIGAVSTTALVAVSGGLAFAFAPAIAATLVGEAAAGLSGAALVSYSLAAIGGGSLAAGGLGMAGGTAIITGGGALLGMLGGTGVSAATTMSLLSDDSYVLAECCKLLTFCRAVLIDRFHDTASVGAIQADIDKQIAALREKLEEEPEKTEEEKAKSEKSEEIEGEIKEKDKAKIAKKSIKYLKNTSDVLRKAVLKEQPANSTKKALPAPPSV